jgi:hypothetical protein
VSYDPKCEELAEHFVPPGTSRRTIQHLAQRIQDFVEDEIEDMIRQASSPLSDSEQ